MKHKVVAYPLMLVITSLLIASCQNRPKEVLNRKEMERLMYDVYLAEATMENDYHNFNSSEKKEAYISRVFKKHNVTQARWDTSLSWYSDRIDIYLKMNDSVKARLKRAQVAIDAQLAQESMLSSPYDPSTYPASYIPPHYSFTAFGARSGFRFRLDSAEIVSSIPEDKFTFTFHAIGIPPASGHVPEALLALVYGDTTLYHHQPITENKSYRISASKYIENDTLSQINGFVHLEKSTEDIPHIQLYNIYLGGERPDPDDVSSDTVSVGAVRKETIQRDTVRKAI